MIRRKTFIKRSDNCERNALNGLKFSYPGIFTDVDAQVYMVLEDREHRVAILSGGGSGHEPFPTGYIADQMLTGAVSGKIFTSPPSGNILAAIEALNNLNRGGVLMIVLNYTGDVLNFGLALESAVQRGIKVEMVVFGDDCALYGDNRSAVVGKRGLCGVIFAFKIAGAMSSMGRKLSNIANEVRGVNLRISTIGICFHACTIPGSKEPLFLIQRDELGVGVGIHGEPGAGQERMMSLPSIVKLMLQKLMAALTLEPNSRICVMVNSLGSATHIEVLSMANEVRKQLVEMEFVIERIYTGCLMTSLDMNGLQVSILNVTSKEEWLDYLDLPTDAYAWPGTKFSAQDVSEYSLPTPAPRETNIGGMSLGVRNRGIFQHCLESACQALKTEEDKLNRLDTGWGDGDCGTTLARFSEEILLGIPDIPFKNVGKTFLLLSEKAERFMGGTSGALYSLLFLGAAIGSKDWYGVVFHAMEIIRKYSSAKEGHRTMMDALIPASEAFLQEVEDLDLPSLPNAVAYAVIKAKEGCRATARMVPKAGRACYVHENQIHDVDAGAYAVTVWLSAIHKGLTEGVDIFYE